MWVFVGALIGLIAYLLVLDNRQFFRSRRKKVKHVPLFGSKEERQAYIQQQHDIAVSRVAYIHGHQDAIHGDKPVYDHTDCSTTTTNCCTGPNPSPEWWLDEINRLMIYQATGRYTPDSNGTSLTQADPIHPVVPDTQHKEGV